jgi:hypothetical protein
VALLLLACVGSVSYFATLPLQLGCKLSFLTLREDKEHLTQIRIPANDIKPDQDEVWVNGTLYDIAAIDFSGDEAILTVYHDTTEELVVKAQSVLLDSFFAPSDNQNTQISTSVHLHIDDKIAGDFFILTPGIKQIESRSEINTRGRFFLDNGYHSQFVPPPRPEHPTV